MEPRPLNTKIVYVNHLPEYCPVMTSQGWGEWQGKSFQDLQLDQTQSRWASVFKEGLVLKNIEEEILEENILESN